MEEAGFGPPFSSSPAANAGVGIRQDREKGQIAVRASLPES
jgi:hypothetical protein